MHRTDAPGNASNLFTDGNAGTGTPATEIEQHSLNAFQEELCNLVEGNGVTLVKDTNTQVRDIMALLYATVQPGGRLTLSTAVPVTTTDVTSQTTVYYTPHKSDKIPLYNGTRWQLYTFAELSQATTDSTKSPAAVANNSNYDMFVWSDSGTLRCTRGPAWTSDTARGTGAGTTELELLNGRYVNHVAVTNGPAAQRGLYVGTIRSDGSAQANDSKAKRHVWNTYNRAARAMSVVEATDTWTYSTATFRQANASAANQLDFVIGLSEDLVRASIKATSTASAGTNVTSTVAVGLDSTSVKATDCINSTSTGCSTNSVQNATPTAEYLGFPGLGRHTLVWLEQASGATTTWQGDNGGTVVQSGIAGTVGA